MAPPQELLGVSVLYLGALNYFFPAEEQLAIVSRIGTVVGQLHVSIAPYVESARGVNGQAERDVASNDGAVFLPYARKHVDDVEEQVYEYMDRSLQYRVEMPEAHGLTTRKFSHVYVKYMFFKGSSIQTPVCLIRDGVALLQERSRHVVVVNDAFVKYLAGSSLTIEVFGCQGDDSMNADMASK